MNDQTTTKKGEKKKKVRPPKTKRPYRPEDGLCRRVRNYARSCGGDYFSVPGASLPTPRAVNVQMKEHERREDRKAYAERKQRAARTRARRARRERKGQSSKRMARRGN